jgi:hypothetical protein
MDLMDFTILEDGTITVKTSEISDGNHMSADALMADLDKLMGGHVDIKENTDELAKAHAHAHKHGLAHTHHHH